jgi:hypothetical protein
MFHHRVDVVRVAVDGDRVVHRELGVGRAGGSTGTDGVARPRRW